MNRSLIALCLAALATASFAAVHPAPASDDDFKFDRTLPTYPELGFDGWRNNAGESEKDNAVRTQLGSIDGYRNHAGESEKDNAVQSQLG
jgi:hypothetical protein